MRSREEVLRSFAGDDGDMSNPFRAMQFVLNNVAGEGSTDIGLTLYGAEGIEKLVNALADRLAEVEADRDRLTNEAFAAALRLRELEASRGGA